ncbi:MAG: Asp-tRNA(Asn)/Glu-tRNA(Gln) amidotransferase subunit GatB [Candidatus Micrarchaeota archaeon]|nr:Asp-tRNA(Asn)/Glu-tRNA(Gln) amidotransferase subunit GatB [Candidatus Micrarchaeota archaeon]
MKVGLEIHVSLPTRTKLFCSCKARGDEDGPNSNVCPICMGFPGSKPALNGKALEYAVMIAAALDCKLSKLTSFVRKVYFYPDLPKSYQITQLSDAVGKSGKLELSTGKAIGITRIQLEEDPAKIIRGDEYTLLDFNRSGRPLVEIVTDPDIRSEDELRDFVAELRGILYHIGVDINEELKADLNVSVDGGERVEVKNVTGIKALSDALKYELGRQNALAGKGQEIKRETRSFDEASMKTISSREKESDEEYGYIYETDLTDYDISRLHVPKPVIPGRIAKEYAKRYKASEKAIREQIMLSREALALMDKAKGRHEMNEIIKGIELLKRYGRLQMGYASFEKLLEAVSTGMLIDEKTIGKIEKGESVGSFKRISDAEIDDSIRKMIMDNEKLLKEYGKNNKVFNFIVGKISKEYGVDPRHVSDRLKAVLDEIAK